MISFIDNFVISADNPNGESSLCERCQLNHECELLEERQLLLSRYPNAPLPDYMQVGCKNCTLNSHFVLVPCSTDSVTTGIGDHFKINVGLDYKLEIDSQNRWEPSQPVFISAQTGKGKNYFVENTLLPYVKALNYKYKIDKKVLILSNRLALQLQTKARISNKYSFSTEYDKIYSYKDCADVMSYQSLLAKTDYLIKKQKNKMANYLYVVCDEAHFFTSDAMFNPNTASILKSIVKVFKDAVRVYMSATPYECLEYIQEYEFKSKSQPSMGVLYHFKRDYKYLDIKYFSEKRELVNKIVNSGNQRWLIFIDNKRECFELKNDLERFSSMEGKVFAADANSKNIEEYQEMLLSERFNENIRILITTSVLDNGVTFRGVNNVVVAEISKVKCLQMLGRARMGLGIDGVTLYIKRVNAAIVRNRIINLTKQQDAYHSYDLAYMQPDRSKFNEFQFLNKYYNNNPVDWENAKHWFARDREEPTRLYLNPIARSLVNTTKQTCESILQDMESETDTKEPTGQRYLEYQLSWFNQLFQKKSDITFDNYEDGKKELIKFLESYIALQIIKDAEAFCEKFTELHDKLFPRQDKNTSRSYKKSKINSILNNHSIDYSIESKRDPTDKKTYWKIVTKST